MNMLDAEQIKAIRNGLKKTQAQFADLVGVSVYAVISWENGTRHPAWKQMAKINELANAKGKADRKAVPA